MLSTPTLDARNKTGFEFDFNRNIIYFNENIINLTPRESDIFHILFANRAHPTSIGELVKRVYGASEPAAAEGSIRVAVHSLRKKLAQTGINISAQPRIGYEIDLTSVPELNSRLTDKITVALNVARSRGDGEIVRHLESALRMAEASREAWNDQGSQMVA